MATNAISDLDKQIEALTKQRNDLLDAWALEACPFEVGQVISNPGYAHKGKKCRVLHISWRRWAHAEYQWRVTAQLIKSDGSDSLNRCDFHQNNLP